MSLYPVERRQFGRRETSIHAWILAEGRPRIPCVVRNLSPAGALLELDVPAYLPFRVTLEIESKNFKAACEVCHTRSRAIGVRFMNIAETKAPIASWSAIDVEKWRGTHVATLA